MPILSYFHGRKYVGFTGVIAPPFSVELWRLRLDPSVMHEVVLQGNRKLRPEEAYPSWFTLEMIEISGFHWIYFTPE